MKKQLWSLVRLALPAVGFALTSSGAYVVSLENQHDYPLMVVPAYVMIVMGFFAMVSGVFWSICHSIKSKVYQRGRLRRQVQVFTIMRPSSFPPSYEESQSSQDTDTAAPHCSSHLLLQSEAVLDVDGEIIGLAPPLYSQVSSEAPDCTWSWEPPPRYSQVERHHPRDSSPAP